MLRVLPGNPACRSLVRVGRRSEQGFVRIRETALKDKVELMLVFRTIGLFPINFSNMQQFRNGNIRSDFFPALPFEGLDEIFARLLFSTGQGEVPAFYRVLFFLDQ